MTNFIRSKRQWLSAVLLLAVLGCREAKQEQKSDGPAPLSVSAVRVASRDIDLPVEFVGRTRGSVDAEIRARVEGVIEKIHFSEGKEVQQGQLLYDIDPAPFRAKVAEAKGKLAEAKTLLAKAESDLKRIRPLAEIKAMSEQDLDAAVAQEGAARGAVEAAVATLESAEIELGYTKITSPTTGIIGISKAKVGEFVGRAPNPVVLNTVSKLDPIHALITINEKEYLYFARLKQKQLETGENGEKRKLELLLADGTVHPETGEVVASDRAIDSATGTMTIEAAFPNPNQIVRPGQFAKIRATGETIRNAIILPTKAIREIQGQNQIFVVKPDNTVEQRTINLGAQIGEFRIIGSNLTDGEIVVVDGIQRLKSGAPVLAQIVELQLPAPEKGRAQG